MRHWLGAHTVDNGGLDMAVRRAANAGMNTMQLFTAIPKLYGDKTSIRPERADRFRAAVKTTGLERYPPEIEAAFRPAPLIPLSESAMIPVGRTKPSRNRGIAGSKMLVG